MTGADIDSHAAKIVDDYDRSAGAFARAAHGIYARLAIPLVEAAAVGPSEQVLDVATGTGAVGSQIDGGVVTGLDASSEQLRQNPLTHRRVGLAEDMPFPDESFDLVVCGFGINHFAEPMAFLDEVRRVLKPSGRLALSTWLRPQPPYAPKEIVLSALAHFAGSARTPAGEAVDALTERVGSVDALAAMLTAGRFSAVGVEVRTVEVPWPGAEAFIAYRLAMLGTGEMLPPSALSDFRRHVREAFEELSPAQLHWLPQVLVATASMSET